MTNTTPTRKITTPKAKATPKVKATPKTTRRLFIDGREFPATQGIAHAAYRFGRHEDGSRMTSPELRAHLAAHGVPTDLFSKSWKCDIGGGHVLQVKAVRLG